MFAVQQELNGRQPSTYLFQWGEEQKHYRLATEEERARTETALTDYGCHLATVPYLKCIGSILL